MAYAGQNSRPDLFERHGKLFIVVLCVLVTLAVMSMSASSPAATATTVVPGSVSCASNNAACNDCISATSSFSSTNLGLDMVQQVFAIINKILNKIESTFYTGIVGSAKFQQIIGMAFMLYFIIYGIMITFSLASYRSGEIAARILKLAIVYAMTTPNGWTFFSTWIQKPVLHIIDEIIVDIASASGSGGSGQCISAGSGSGTSVIGSNGGPIGTSGSTYISLATGPMAMLFGPMTCIYGTRFVATLVALLTTGFYGWVLALILIWGLLEFSLLLLGAIVTYVKAIVGLVFLFGLAPIFFTFYLFQKSRSLTEGWLNMVAGFALQPIMLFTFLAFYAGIIGAALQGMFVNSGGSSLDVCYVQWYSMPGLASIYWWKFKDKYGAAGGQWLNNSSTGSSAFGDPLPPAIQVLNILYFVVLCNLGKNFTKYIETISNQIAGGRGGGVVTGREVGSWFKNNMAGGQSAGQLAGKAGQQVSRSIGNLLGGRGPIRPPLGGGAGGTGLTD